MGRILVVRVGKSATHSLIAQGAYRDQNPCGFPFVQVLNAHPDQLGRFADTHKVIVHTLLTLLIRYHQL